MGIVISIFVYIGYFVISINLIGSKERIEQWFSIRGNIDFKQLLIVVEFESNL